MTLRWECFPSRTRCRCELGVLFFGRKRASGFLTSAFTIFRAFLEHHLRRYHFGLLKSADDLCQHVRTTHRLSVFLRKTFLRPVIQHQTKPDAFHRHAVLIEVFRALRMFSQTWPRLESVVGSSCFEPVVPLFTIPSRHLASHCPTNNAQVCAIGGQRWGLSEIRTSAHFTSQRLHKRSNFVVHFLGIQLFAPVRQLLAIARSAKLPSTMELHVNVIVHWLNIGCQNRGPFSASDGSHNRCPFGLVTRLFSNAIPSSEQLTHQHDIVFVAKINCCLLRPGSLDTQQHRNVVVPSASLNVIARPASTSISTVAWSMTRWIAESKDARSSANPTV